VFERFDSLMRHVAPWAERRLGDKPGVMPKARFRLTITPEP
jgi:hypothetical protein